MTHIDKPDLAVAVIDLVTDTFDMPPGSITEATVPGAVNGWDSLGHSVLLTRLARRFRLTMTEDLAMPVNNVAELINVVRHAAGRVHDA